MKITSTFDLSFAATSALFLQGQPVMRMRRLFWSTVSTYCNAISFPGSLLSSSSSRRFIVRRVILVAPITVTTSASMIRNSLRLRLSHAAVWTRKDPRSCGFPVELSGHHPFDGEQAGEVNGFTAKRRIQEGVEG